MRSPCVLLTALWPLPILGILSLVLFGAAEERAPLPVFVDVTAKAGIAFQLLSSRTPQKYLIESMPGGVAMLDYDGDGFADLFFVNGARLDSPMPPGAAPDKSDSKYWNRLYHNNGDGTFTDVTEKAGVKVDGGRSVQRGWTTTRTVVSTCLWAAM